MKLCQKEKEGLRWQASAILALQEGFEDYLITLFHDMVLAAIHGRRKTVMPKDIHIVRQLHGETDPLCRVDKYERCAKEYWSKKEMNPGG